MRGDAVFYLFIFLCATFYYYGTNLLSAFNALQRGALSIPLSPLLTHTLWESSKLVRSDCCSVCCLQGGSWQPAIMFNINKSLGKVN